MADENGNAETKTEPQADRDEAQEQQLEAQHEGNLGKELGGFLKEMVADQKQFPKDIAADSKDPDRRVDEEQGTVEHPAHEPNA